MDLLLRVYGYLVPPPARSGCGGAAAGGLRRRWVRKQGHEAQRLLLRIFSLPCQRWIMAHARRWVSPSMRSGALLARSMETIMDAMVNRSRTVDGAQIACCSGASMVGLDGG